MVFYCVQDAPTGGETIFVSGVELCDHLQRVEPELFEQLVSQPVRYAKAANARETPIITYAGALPSLNYNYFCVAADQPRAAIELNERLHRYLEDDLPRELIMEVPLGPGEAVAWWDNRVLHGRNAFEAARTNDRFIWKTAVQLAAAA